MILIYLTKSDILGSVSDKEYYFETDELYFIVENDFFKFETSNEQTAPQLFKKHYIQKNAEIKLFILLATNQRGKLIYVSKNSQQNNLTIKITNLNAKSSSLDVIFLQEKKETKEPDFITFYTSSTNFFTFSNHESKINYRVIYSKDDEIITQVLNTEERRKVIVCYGGKECSKTKEFSINWEENYLTGINESTIEGKLKEFIPSGGIESMRIYFDSHNPSTPTIDFSSIPLESIEKVELIGRPGHRPQIIKIINHEQAEIKSKLTTRNIQFFDEKRLIRYFSESFYHHDTKKSIFETGDSIDQVIFPIYPKFAENQNITLEIKREYLSMQDVNGVEIDKIFFVKGKSTVLLIQNEETSFNNTIFIKPVTLLGENIDSGNISIDFEDCDSISIQFSEWKEKDDVPEIMFNFYTDNETELNIISSKNKKIKYRHYHYFDGEPTTIHDQYPTAYAFCLKNSLCNEQEYADLDPIVKTINADDISNEIKNELDYITIQSLKNLIIFLNIDGVEFDLSFLDGKDFQQIKFINSGDDNVNVRFTKLPEKHINEWVIKNCSLDVSVGPYEIDELYSYYSFISWDNLIIKHGTYVMNADLITEDNIIEISENKFILNDKEYNSNDNLTLTIKTEPNTDNSFIFKPKENSGSYSDICLNFEGVDEIPITIENNWDKITEKLTIQINVSKTEHIIINRIPANIDFIVYSKELEKNIQQIYANSTNFVLCYLSDECVKQKEFSIDNDATFISTKTEPKYEQIIRPLKKKYKYLRLSFVDEGEIIDNFKLNEIPSDIFEQLQLYGYGNNDVQILLDDESDTSRFDNWVICHVSFAKKLNIKYKFNELLVLDTNPVFQDVSEYSDNITIGTARFHCYYGQDVDGLSNVNSVNYTIYELFPDLSESDYTLSISGFSFIANGDPLIQPLKNKFHFYVHTSPLPINHKFYISRYGTLFDDVSIEFENLTDIVHIEFTCSPDEINRPFDYLFMVDDVDLIRTNQGNCDLVNTTINGKPHVTSTPKPTGTPSQSYTTFFTLSSVFTSSRLFSSSSGFSKSLYFSNTTQFSESIIFSESIQFSESIEFSESYKFTKSFQFTESYHFSDSLLFSKSSVFTVSTVFSLSSQFTASAYPPTTQFTGSQNFSESLSFSESSLFTESNAFEPSSHFTPSFIFQYNLPDSDQISQSLIVDSSLFIMTSVGFVNENNDQVYLSHFIEPLTTIFFTSRNIKITENDEFSLPTTLYFSANETGSTILIDRNLYKTVIGVKTDNSPTIILTNTESPLNIMNYKKHGFSAIDIVHMKKVYEVDRVDLVLNELNNSNGYLTINVEPNVRSVSFASLFMSRISSLKVRYKNTDRYLRSSPNLLDDSSETHAEIIVEDDINVGSKSDVVLHKINIKGKLNIYEDSSLTLKDRITFSDQSMINFFFVNSKRSTHGPIIKIESLLNSTPSEIFFIFEGKSKSSDVSNFVVLEATNFKSCLSWIEKVHTNDNKRKIKAQCEYVKEGSTQLIFTAKKDKLSIGAIMGITVGCIAFVIIVTFSILFAVRKKNREEDHGLLENSGIEHSTF